MITRRQNNRSLSLIANLLSKRNTPVVQRFHKISNKTLNNVKHIINTSIYFSIPLFSCSLTLRYFADSKVFLGNLLIIWLLATNSLLLIISLDDGTLDSTNFLFVSFTLGKTCNWMLLWAYDKLKLFFCLLILLSFH